MTDSRFHRPVSCALTGLLILTVAGCASTPPAPVEDRSGRSRSRADSNVVRPPSGAAIHRVQRGDTLYSIAFRNGLDYRELARINGIGSSYTIYIGQELRLSEGRAAPSQAVASSKPVVPVNRTAPSSGNAASKPLATSSGASSSAPVVAPPTKTSAPAAIAASPPTPPAKSPVTAQPTPVTAPASAAASSGVTWRWPADGQRIGSYVAGDQTRQGIDIAGKAGDPVRAAADGEIVYSGNGLIGYGELIIVKHNASMLSAYGHNRRRLVQEGDKVKAGQQIAEMGSSSASRDMLHFEIRRNGKPVDPLGFLPAR